MRIPITGLLLDGPSGEKTVQLENPLGSGAFGVVFKAKDSITGIQYAVKFPQFVFFGGPADLTAFFNEVQAAREIRHPNVVQILHVETASTDLPPYLVMEFIEGGTLKSRLENFRGAGSLPPLDFLQALTAGLIDGISAINSKMLHRDLKPDNILMDGDTPKIGDFGLSKIVGAATRSQTFKGGQHIFYMAPEGWKLETNNIQIDMYSMGIILFEIASLSYPYDLPPNPNDFNAIRDMHLFQQPKSLQAIRSDVPIGYVHIVSRLLEKNPQTRFTDWSQVKKGLEKTWLFNSSTSPTPKYLVATLLEETARAHQTKTQERLEREKRAAEEIERSHFDDFQRESLIKIVKTTIGEFNEQSTLGLVREVSHHITGLKGNYVFTLPFGETLKLDFFRVDPPLNLKVGKVRFAAHLYGSNDLGLNYLLCRTDEADLYGTWMACLAKQHAWVRKEPRPEPFGFTEQDIHEIEVADGASHIYEIKISNEIGDTFLQIVLEIIRRITHP